MDNKKSKTEVVAGELQATPDEMKLKDVVGEFIELERNYNMRINEVTKEFDEQRDPLRKQRDEIIAKIPEFWKVVCLKNSVLCGSFTSDDCKLLSFLDKLTVDIESKNDKQNTTITLEFLDNPMLWNRTLSKTLTEASPDGSVDGSEDGDEDVREVITTPIKWKDEFNPKTPENIKKRGPNNPREESFFDWFTHDDGEDGLFDVFTEVYQRAHEIYFSSEEDIDVPRMLSDGSEEEDVDEEDGDEEDEEEEN
mmetsp:Transcript_29826/g.41238  ORF Transcript_29826/g.41238 Transcript_29826/m.41238 type:complete len:252 (+) Transcript_29826:63-818(+)|eukprot:CAMPEP_0196579112 /NCGR_PEP_ID=MMETSP1081-20130531/17652_1 /TAXON_ID=36882 /ORGANISM="Pyramimonas amylifera, Strain CCMP720" /LENGTH=251 /DNA_ID=CAMNT_0041898575 /DNA_START=63 /DNA_END=818 /DNA_ORIENTATION=+